MTKNALLLHQHKRGLAVDIDDTIVDTSLKVAQILWDDYPIAGYDSASEVLETWGMPSMVPHWKIPHIQAKIFSLLNDPEFLVNLPPIVTAITSLKKIGTVYSIAFYLTSRTPDTQKATEEWLKKYNLPSAPVICRDPNITHRDWKAWYINKYLPKTLGIIDNELFLPDGMTHPGRFIEIVRFKKLSPKHPRQEIFDNWSQVISSLFPREKFT